MDIPATSDAIPGTLVLRDSTGGCSLAGDLTVGVNSLTQKFAGYGHLELRGVTDGGLFQISTAVADGDGAQIGQVMWVDRNSTASGGAGKAVASILCQLSGSTANNRGASLSFFSKSDNAAIFSERLKIKSNGQVRFIPLAADPAGAEAGDVYYNSGDSKLKVYNGTSWVNLH